MWRARAVRRALPWRLLNPLTSTGCFSSGSGACGNGMQIGSLRRFATGHANGEESDYGSLSSGEQSDGGAGAGGSGAGKPQGPPKKRRSASDLTKTVGGPRTSVTIQATSNSPGVLYEILQKFQQNHVNLTHVESQLCSFSWMGPVFNVDMEGTLGNPSIDRVLADLREHVGKQNVRLNQPKQVLENILIRSNLLIIQIIVRFSNFIRIRNEI